MNFMVRFRIALLSLTVLSCASGSVVAAPQPARSPKGIILIIGDGMGAAHFTAARILRGNEFQSGRLPVVGLVATRSANSIVTDSAASATAYSTGFKTNNRMISVDPSGNPLRTVLELAEANGMATGLVTTTRFWDATPAVFAAHARDRRETLSIIGQMLRSGADLIASSGLEFFGVEGNPPIESLARDSGYALVTNAAELQTVKGSLRFWRCSAPRRRTSIHPTSGFPFSRPGPSSGCRKIPTGSSSFWSTKERIPRAITPHPSSSKPQSVPSMRLWGSRSTSPAGETMSWSS